MKRFVWLASYPKSGNTWFRIFLTNYLRNADEPADINDLERTPIASARLPFDEAVGYDSGEMTHDEIDALRPEVYRRQADLATEPIYTKVHDAYTYLPNGRPLFPPEVTAQALYFVRNPLDVAVSYAHHGGHHRFGRVIQRLGNPESIIAANDLTEDDQLRQKLTTWSHHVTSWTTAPGIRTCLLRYEDMLTRPEQTFAIAVQHLGLPEDPQRLAKALAFSHFSELQKQEGDHGFNERLTPAKAFFREGKTGTWRGVLNAEQIAKVIADHGPLMHELGYLNAAGEPL